MFLLAKMSQDSIDDVLDVLLVLEVVFERDQGVLDEVVVCVLIDVIKSLTLEASSFPALAEHGSEEVFLVLEVHLVLSVLIVVQFQLWVVVLLLLHLDVHTIRDFIDEPEFTVDLDV